MNTNEENQTSKNVEAVNQPTSDAGGKKDKKGQTDKKNPEGPPPTATDPKPSAVRCTVKPTLELAVAKDIAKALSDHTKSCGEELTAAEMLGWMFRLVGRDLLKKRAARRNMMDKEILCSFTGQGEKENSARDPAKPVVPT